VRVCGLLTTKAKASAFLAAEQKKRPSLSADFLWTLAGNVIYAGGQFATLILLAKLVRPEKVGEYALGLAIVYPVMMFTNLQLRAVISAGNHQEIHFGNYVGLRLLSTLLAFVIISAATQILGYGKELTTVVLVVSWAYAIETVSDVYYARLQLHDRMAEIAKSRIARTLLSTLGLAITTYLTRSILWGIAASALARIIILLGYDVSERTHGFGGRSNWLLRSEALAPRFDLRALGKLLLLSLPLGIIVLLGCLNSSIPNFFIKDALGEREVGFFAAIGFMVSVGNMAVVSLGQSAFTRLARSFAAGNTAAFHSLLGKLLAFGAAIGVGGTIISKLAGREMLTLLFRPEYAERSHLLPWIMGAGGVFFMAQFLGFGMTAANFYYSQVLVNILANMSLLAACYWMVQRRGLLGAILAMLIAAAVQLAGSVIVLAMGARTRLQLCTEKIDQAEVIRAIPLSTERSPAIHGD
jgi:O-antigen/teichoic acid export membrane protein